MIGFSRKRHTLKNRICPYCELSACLRVINLTSPLRIESVIDFEYYLLNVDSFECIYM